MKQKWIQMILIGGIFFLLCFFTFQAVTTDPFEFDSITYHIPLAKSILNGKILHPDKLNFSNSAFPAATEIILAVMIFFHIPLNLFNVIAWISLGYILFLLGKRFNLGTYSYIFSFSVITLPTVIRLLLCQTADMWLSIFFVWTLYLLQKPEKKILYFFQLGLSAGLLIGSKYSGPLFLTALLLVYGKKVFPYVSFVRLVYFIIPLFMFGLSWYIRNMLIFSNPFYPAPFLWMKGISAFSPTIFLSHFKMITTVKNGLLFTTNAILSEYLFWPFIIMFAIYFKIASHKTSIVLDEEIKLLILGFTGVLIYLIIPGYAYNYNNYVSEIRYSIPIITSFILLLFYVLRKSALMRFIPLFVFLNFVAIYTLVFQGGYHPKIIVIIGIAIFLIINIYFPTKQMD